MDEAAVKVAEAEESLKLFEFLWCWPFCNAGDFDRVHLDLSLEDDDARVLNEELVEGAFFGFEMEIIFGEAGEDVMGELVEGGEIVVEDEDVVEVDDEVIPVDEI